VAERLDVGAVQPLGGQAVVAAAPEAFQSRGKALTFVRTLLAPPQRCWGSSSLVHAFAAWASHG